MLFTVLKDIYWDNWGQDVRVARKGEEVHGELNIPFNPARPWEYSSITVDFCGRNVTDFASQDEVMPVSVKPVIS